MIELFTRQLSKRIVVRVNNGFSIKPLSKSKSKSKLVWSLSSNSCVVKVTRRELLKENSLIERRKILLTSGSLSLLVVVVSIPEKP